MGRPGYRKPPPSGPPPEEVAPIEDPADKDPDLGVEEAPAPIEEETRDAAAAVQETTEEVSRSDDDGKVPAASEPRTKRKKHGGARKAPPVAPLQQIILPASQQPVPQAVAPRGIPPGPVVAVPGPPALVVPVAHPVVYVPPPLTPAECLARDTLCTVLGWLGILGRDNQLAFHAEFGPLPAWRLTTKENIASLVKKPLVTTQGVAVPINSRKINNLHALCQWVTDQYKVEKDVDFEKNEEILRGGYHFPACATRAFLRAKERAYTVASEYAESTSCMPDKLQNASEWKVWSTKLAHALSIRRGSNGIPLIYVIRDDNAPKVPYDSDDFDARCIDKAPHDGDTFMVDTKTVHYMIVSKISGTHSEQWIQDILAKCDGRADYFALRNYCDMESTTIRRITDAEHLWGTLHYANEKRLAYASFLDKAITMFNIFRECGEPKQDTAKVRWLLAAVRAPELTDICTAIKVAISTPGGMATWTFSQTSSHIATAVSANRYTPVIAGVNAKTSAAPPKKPANKPGGGKMRSYTSAQWNALSQAERDTHKAARKKHTAALKEKGDAAPPNMTSMMKMIKDQNKIIAALSKRTRDDSDGNAEPSNDAGTAFGGRASMNKKNKTTD
jgi:hypothetical protein